MTAVPEPTVTATEYTVSVLPEGHIDERLFAITVAYRSEGRWAITRHRNCLGQDGTWEYEMQPSNREDEWKATHRFDLDTALALAVEAAPGVKCNGITAAEVAARQGARNNG